jgi:4-hydroxy-tetrahydrodipicolinate synthase
MQFGSLITAMITPFKEEDRSKIDFESVEKITEHLINTGSDSIVISGTTGESPTLSHEEEEELFKRVKSVVDSSRIKVPLIFGAGSNSTSTAIKSSKKAEDLGANGLLIVSPYYNKPNREGLKKHYSEIAKNTHLPIILYNVPGRCVVSLDADSILDLAENFSNVIALKEASNNLDLVSKVRSRLSKKDFSIYSGDDSLSLPMLAIGADGVISVASHLVGKDIQAMIAKFQSGQVNEAREIHLKLFPLFEALFVEPNPTCIKEALSLMSFCSSELRLPLVNLESNQRHRLKRIVCETLDIRLPD